MRFALALYRLVEFFALGTRPDSRMHPGWPSRAWNMPAGSPLTVRRIGLRFSVCEGHNERASDWSFAAARAKQKDYANSPLWWFLVEKLK